LDIVYFPEIFNPFLHTIQRTTPQSTPTASATSTFSLLPNKGLFTPPLSTSYLTLPTSPTLNLQLPSSPNLHRRLPWISSIDLITSQPIFDRLFILLHLWCPPLEAFIYIAIFRINVPRFPAIYLQFHLWFPPRFTSSTPSSFHRPYNTTATSPSPPNLPLHLNPPLAASSTFSLLCFTLPPLKFSTYTATSIAVLNLTTARAPQHSFNFIASSGPLEVPTFVVVPHQSQKAANRCRQDLRNSCCSASPYVAHKFDLHYLHQPILK